MLTGKMVRVRFARNNRVVPHYLDVTDPASQETAERLLALFRDFQGRTRGELEEEQQQVFGDEANLVHQGLAKLLEDRCEFTVESDQPPEVLRAAVFRAASEQRRQLHFSPDTPSGFDRGAVLRQVAGELGLTPEQVDQGLFADLKSEQKLVQFEDTTPERLLQRYNVALAQAVLYRAVGIKVIVRREPPQRYRQLLRRVKFHRLVCTVEEIGPESYKLHLDGPLSLFSATQKYGLQLALFLPAVLLCKDFELTADLRWGPQRKPKEFVLTAKEGLVSHAPDTGMYVPAELGMFAELFRKRIKDWELVEETEVLPLGSGFWVPDFRLVHRDTGRVVMLEVLGFWRRSSAEAHLRRLREHADEPFLLAVSDQLHIEDGELADLPAGIHRFRNMPLPDEIARLAGELIR
jgi:predicted nuclease of restriction endonuclease-like RecB superfamily